MLVSMTIVIHRFFIYSQDLQWLMKNDPEPEPMDV